MGSKLRFQTFSLSLLFFVFLFGQSYHVTEGFKQTLQLYFNTTKEGQFLHFEDNLSNLEDYSALLPKVQLACALGRWFSFSAANYLGTHTGFGSLSSNQTQCVLFNATNTKSVRHNGLSETRSDGLSLYEAGTYTGTEILVAGSTYAGITTPVMSITGTGNSQWKLFEGQHLEGKSVCITVPKPGINFYWEYDVQSSLNLTTIGSVFKGCNIREIKEYKRQNNI